MDAHVHGFGSPVRLPLSFVSPFRILLLSSVLMRILYAYEVQVQRQESRYLAETTASSMRCRLVARVVKPVTIIARILPDMKSISTFFPLGFLARSMPQSCQCRHPTGRPLNLHSDSLLLLPAYLRRLTG
jgi:hypothetical protein